MATKPVLVFKIGTSSITTPQGFVDEPLMAEVVKQISELHQSYHIVIVSSGAVGTGKKYIKDYSGKIDERKAAAAIGNPILINKYAGMFEPYGIPIAQSLCERSHFSHRNQFLQLRDTYEELWRNGVIPIANENDVVSSRELKFSDNDELATLLAVGFGAELLLIATSVPGVLDQNGEVVRKIERFDESVLGLATKEKSAAGLGGMVSKLTFAKLATHLGIRVCIFSARAEKGILEAVSGTTGTVCIPRKATANARQKWLASGSLISGSIVVDAGARKALEGRKSLLMVGVKEIPQGFSAGDVIDIADENGEYFAVARVRTHSSDLLQRVGEKKLIVAAADDIVVL
jgi:glutamate 5-kinase